MFEQEVAEAREYLRPRATGPLLPHRAQRQLRLVPVPDLQAAVRQAGGGLPAVGRGHRPRQLLPVGLRQPGGPGDSQRPIPTAGSAASPTTTTCRPPKDFTLEPNVGGDHLHLPGQLDPGPARHGLRPRSGAWRDQAKCQWIGLWEYFCYCAMSQYQPMFPKVCPKLLGEDVKRLHRWAWSPSSSRPRTVLPLQGRPRPGLGGLVQPDLALPEHLDPLQAVGRHQPRRWRACWTTTTASSTGRRPRPSRPSSSASRSASPTPACAARRPSMTSPATSRWPTGSTSFPPEVMAEAARATPTRPRPWLRTSPYKTRVDWVREGFLAPAGAGPGAVLTQQRDDRCPEARGTASATVSPPRRSSTATAPTRSGQTLPPHFLNDWRSGAAPEAADLVPHGLRR